MTTSISTLVNDNDLIDNPAARCACMVVLDTSASMEGAPIDQLNRGFRDFIASLQKDEVAACSVDIGVITAGGSVSEVLPFTTVISLDSFQHFSANGGTPLGSAVNLALTKLEARKQEYQAAGVAYYQPWLVVISDGEPTDSWQAAASLSQSQSAQRKLVVMPIGVAGANLDTLSQFSSRPAKALDGLKFSEFFEWLSASLSRVSASSPGDKINLPPTDAWDSI